MTAAERNEPEFIRALDCFRVSMEGVNRHLAQLVELVYLAGKNAGIREARRIFNAHKN